MRGEYEELLCPFCEKGKIIALHFPSVWTEKRSLTATFGSRKNKRKTRETWVTQSGCSVCGKTKEEVEKELRRKMII
jgi:formate dehydrogenase assembly factor FdhD